MLSSGCRYFGVVIVIWFLGVGSAEIEMFSCNLSDNSSKYLEFRGGQAIGVQVEELGNFLLGVEALAGLVFLLVVSLVSCDELIKADPLVVGVAGFTLLTPARM
ncbi:hypothetical protein LOD99_7366 [Oopsacas minuta]|uniref:Uncharacterized protein n=1 Tax=Oopsacas minuta TaxID=111878 RepID=A0AAV7JTT7_9METZ|nr:hypothetical protein LOD99_7366 [Oopsacas minuta]